MTEAMNAGTTPAPPRPVILLVEDEALVRQVMALELEDAGYEVLEAGDGGEALELLEQGRPVDLLFTDIRMPGALDGWQLAEQVRARCPELPVVYATGFSEDAPRLVAGALFFRKPYRAAAVIEAIRQLGVAPAA